MADEKFVFTGMRPVEECPQSQGPHTPHLWAPSLGINVEEDEVTPDIRHCNGGYPIVAFDEGSI